MVATVSVIPTVEDARRVARVFAEEHGVGAVLLFGSVAEGSAGESSDIDLVAVYDDLDYATRTSQKSRLQLKLQLEAAAHECIDRRVDVLVTDRLKWQHRSEQISNTFERGIRDSIITLLDEPQHPLNLELIEKMPASEHLVPEQKLRDIEYEIDNILRSYAASARELSVRQSQSTVRADGFRRHRLARLCASSVMVVEHGLKALIAMSGKPPIRTHDLSELIDEIDSSLTDRCAELPDSLLRQGSAWRQAGTYEETLEALIEADDLSDEALCELTAQYIEVAAQFSPKVADAYHATYPDAPEVARRVSDVKETVEALTSSQTATDLWTGDVRRAK